jgi:thioredoxin-like negative regulator of GroEL
MRKIDTEKLTLAIRFTADWCNPCKQFAPTFDAAAKDFPEVMKLVAPVGEFGDLADDFEVRGIPCTVFIKDGQEVGRLNGSQPEEVVRKEFEKLK